MENPLVISDKSSLTIHGSNIYFHIRNGLKRFKLLFDSLAIVFGVDLYGWIAKLFNNLCKRLLKQAHRQKNATKELWSYSIEISVDYSIDLFCQIISDRASSHAWQSPRLIHIYILITTECSLPFSRPFLWS